RKIVRTRAPRVRPGALAGARFVDAQAAPLQGHAVGGVDGRCAIGVLHLDEPETTRSAGLAGADDFGRMDGAILAEQFAQFVLGGCKREVAHLDAFHYCPRCGASAGGWLVERPGTWCRPSTDGAGAGY